MTGEGAPTFSTADEERGPSNYEGLGLRATVVWSDGHPPLGFPEGKDGETRPGFAFYEVQTDGSLREDPITADITDKPELVAADEEEYNHLQGVTIIAKPVNFVWSTDRKTWTVEF